MSTPIGQTNKIETEAALVCSTLVREIAAATRWTEVKAAADAIANARRLSAQLVAELQRNNATGYTNNKITNAPTSGGQLYEKQET